MPLLHTFMYAYAIVIYMYIQTCISVPKILIRGTGILICIFIFLTGGGAFTYAPPPPLAAPLLVRTERLCVTTIHPTHLPHWSPRNLAQTMPFESSAACPAGSKASVSLTGWPQHSDTIGPWTRRIGVRGAEGESYGHGGPEQRRTIVYSLVLYAGVISYGNAWKLSTHTPWTRGNGVPTPPEKCKKKLTKVGKVLAIVILVIFIQFCLDLLSFPVHMMCFMRLRGLFGSKLVRWKNFRFVPSPVKSLPPSVPTPLIFKRCGRAEGGSKWPLIVCCIALKMEEGFFASLSKQRAGLQWSSLLHAVRKIQHVVYTMYRTH